MSTAKPRRARVDGWHHHHHPLAGHPVEDTATGRVGLLRDVVDVTVVTAGIRRTVQRAYVVPAGGGIEWDTAPENIRPA